MKKTKNPKIGSFFYRFVHLLFCLPGINRLKQTFFWKGLTSLYRNIAVFTFVVIPSFITLFIPLFVIPKKKQIVKKTIIVMIHSLGAGGAERVVTNLVSGLTKTYHVILLAPEHTIKGNFYGKYIDPSVEIAPLPFELFRFNSKNNIGYFLLVCYIKALKKRKRALASISFLYEMNVLNVASKRREKVICSERNNPIKFYIDAARIDQIRAIYQRADHVVFQSETVRDYFGDSVKSCSILPNPVVVYCRRNKDTIHRIFNVGRLDKQKNQEMLVRAFRRFHDLHPEYELSIYGKGPLKNNLESLIKTLGLSGAAKLEGLSAQIHQDVANAEFFVLSSDYEGLSNALLEAMAMGFPCISTDCEGSTDVIQNGVNGLLVRCGSEDELFKAMLFLAENPVSREHFGRRASMTAKRFEKEIVAKEWAEMIESIS